MGPLQIALIVAGVVILLGIVGFLVVRSRRRGADDRE
jgi:LPXTG-motif cell wall-anchored protein